MIGISMLYGGPAGWIESVTAKCRQKLAPLFQLTTGERAFLDTVLERGEIDVSTLDAPEAVRAAIGASAALRWKAQNVKAWKSGDKSLAPRTKRKQRGDSRWTAETIGLAAGDGSQIADIQSPIGGLLTSN